jgi:hypothetical protein
LNSYIDYNVRNLEDSMKTATIRLFVLSCAVAFSLTALADDQEKGTKEIKKITSIAVDTNMRAIVNRTMADLLKAKRLDLVKQRQDMNLNYGDLFLAQQLAASGVKMDDIAAQLKSGKTVLDIANATRRSTTTSRSFLLIARNKLPSTWPTTTTPKPTKFPLTRTSAKMSTPRRRPATLICTMLPAQHCQREMQTESIRERVCPLPLPAAVNTRKF